MKVLSTSDIDEILKSNKITKKRFIGTFPSCIYPYTSRGEYSFISNTEDHTKSGMHWVAWYIKDNCVTFFDSFGRSPFSDTFPQEYTDFIGKYNLVKYTSKPIQKSESTTCGYFCIHFIYLLSLGLGFESFLEDYFDLNKNDIVVYNFYNSIIYKCVLLSQMKQQIQH